MRYGLRIPLPEPNHAAWVRVAESIDALVIVPSNEQASTRLVEKFNESLVASIEILKLIHNEMLNRRQLIQ
jgi:hypothetical protein